MRIRRALHLLVGFHAGLLLLGSLLNDRGHAEGPLSTMDVDPTITSCLGSSRVSRWLIEQADPANSHERINRHLLGDAVMKVIQSSRGFSLLAEDLSAGDADLARSWEQILAGFNFSPAEVRGELHALAEGSDTDPLRATVFAAIQREASRRYLEDYVLATPEDWGATLQGLQDILAGTSPLHVSLLAEVFRRSGIFEDQNLTELLQGARRHDVEAEWDLARGLHSLRAEQGALARQLSTTPLQRITFAGAVWRQLLKTISEDPLLRKEYQDRLNEARPLSREWQSVLVQCLQVDHDEIIRGFLQGGVIPGSRYAWVLGTLREDRPEWRGLDLNYLTNSSKLRRQLTLDLARHVEREPQWSDYLLWELTRPAEAAARSLREALPETLADPQVARNLWTTSDWGPERSQRVNRERLFGFYPGGEVEFRTRLEAGTLDPAALRQFGRGWGSLLADSDEDWNRVAAGHDVRDRERLRLLFQAAFQHQPATVEAWLETIRSNDQNLSEHWRDWLVREKHLTDPTTYHPWLDTLSENIHSQKIVGNPDLSNFKTWFLDYLATDDGDRQVRLRLSMESYGLPESLREAMARVLQHEPDRFWRIFGLISHTPGLDSARQELRDFIDASPLSECLMEEVSGQNQAANEAMEPAWRELLSPESPTLRAMQEAVEKGSTLSDLHQLVVLALDQTLGDPRWTRATAIELSSGPQGPLTGRPMLEAYREQLRTNGSESSGLLHQLLENHDLRAEWQRKLLSAVNYLGKGYIIADFILHHNELQLQWNAAIARAVLSDPGVAQVLLTSLSFRRTGDIAWQERLSLLRYQLARIMVENRPLFETCLAHPARTETPSDQKSETASL